MVSGVCFFMSIKYDHVNETIDGDDVTLTVLPMVALLLILLILNVSHCTGFSITYFNLDNIHCIIL